jgi:hypothetical protein
VNLARKAKKEKDVEAYRHETEKRKNVVPAGLASYDTASPKPRKYEYDPHLDNIKQQFLTASNQGISMQTILPALAKWLILGQEALEKKLGRQLNESVGHHLNSFPLQSISNRSKSV